MCISRIESIAVSVCDCLQRKLSWELSVRPICSRLNALSANIVRHSSSRAFLLNAGERNEPPTFLRSFLLSFGNVYLFIPAGKAIRISN